MITSDLSRERLAALAAVLAARAGSIDMVTPRAWRLPCPGREPATAVASVDGEWLHFETPLPCRHANALPGPRQSLGLLQANAFLPSGTNYGIDARRRGTYLVTDVLVQDDQADVGDLASAVQGWFDAFCSIRATAPSQRSANSDRSVQPPHTPLTVDHDAGEATRSLCDRTGWTYHERRNGQLAITLDVPEQFCQAQASLVGTRGYRLSTALSMPANVSAKSSHAIAVLLLTASHVVRVARAVALADGNKWAYRWEVVWPRLPTEVQFQSGLSALSIACRMTVGELQALCDRSIAGTYLMLRRRSS